ncbi:menaquinol-cytochrome c reductase cytochrome b/c subunit [Alkalibacillus haloalkaliphilus]|uniref:Menaquinol-cytochrome c reductase cytochrome b/c subunit n=1 Tax=Alkalibacillus haloalkaliphilus TaxID=94136 RepID=A0A511W255_9BACI|nr:menaquinol-cytochrome c reductase cytochrome b/c subunit [Alkalibacillus haloalkaliphilus]GEN45146.1 menaquinol-cytochrome c reductase cytochrome b/c subunit [Alkalibacillus haloalkaliphilus]
MHRGKGMKFVGDSRVQDKEQRNTIPKDYSEYPGRTEAFWPNYLLKEWLVGAVFLIGFLCYVAVTPVSLEQQADPNNAAYIPLPDWYFLFLYELLKYEFAAAEYIVIGTVGIPGLAFGALLLAPFLDTKPGRRPSQRPIATGMMLIGVLATIWLTYESVVAVDWETREEYSVDNMVEHEVDETHPGYEVYAQNCMSCHGGVLEGEPGLGPDLLDLPHTADTIAEISVEGIGDMPAGMFDGTDEELQQLANFIVENTDTDDGEGGDEDTEE